MAESHSIVPQTVDMQQLMCSLQAGAGWEVPRSLFQDGTGLSVLEFLVETELLILVVPPFFHNPGFVFPSTCLVQPLQTGAFRWKLEAMPRLEAVVSSQNELPADKPQSFSACQCYENVQSAEQEKNLSGV